MNSLRFSFLALSVCLGLLGCDSKDPLSRVAAGSKSAPQATAETPKKDKPAAPPKPDLDRSKIPATLMTDAYSYYGLANGKTMDIEITQKPLNKVYTGTTTAHLNEVGKDSATFSTETTGSFHDLLGDDVAVLKPDGIYQVTSDKMTVGTPMLELPASIAAGVKWTVDSDVTTKGDPDTGGSDQKSHWKFNFKSVGIQPLTLDGVTYQALNVVASGTITIPGAKATVYGVSEKEWFVKDIGMVRSEIMRTMKGQPSVTFVMVWKPEHKTTKP